MNGETGTQWSCNLLKGAPLANVESGTTPSLWAPSPLLFSLFLKLEAVKDAATSGNTWVKVLISASLGHFSLQLLWFRYEVSPRGLYVESLCPPPTTSAPPPPLHTQVIGPWGSAVASMEWHYWGAGGWGLAGANDHSGHTFDRHFVPHHFLCCSLLPGRHEVRRFLLPCPSAMRLCLT